MENGEEAQGASRNRWRENLLKAMAKRKATPSVGLPEECPPEVAMVWDCDVLRYRDEIGSQGWLVERFLGKGGFGAVYLAADRQNPDQKVAVKIFSADIDNDVDKGMQRIVNEAAILEAVGAVYAPAIYDQGEKDGRPYIVMEYMDAIHPDNDDLPSDSREIREFFLELIESLKALHRAGWIHCDIKPENIAKRKSDGRLVLIDYGSAHKIEETEDEHVPSPLTMNTRNSEYVRVETRGYAPPELCFRPCRDIYALGHVMRDCFKQDVPLEWSLVINKCISNNRAYRYADLEKLESDILNIDRIGRDEMRRCVYEDRCKFMNTQASIAAANPQTYRWLRLKDLLEKKQEDPHSIYAGAGQVFIDFDILETRSVDVIGPVTLKEDRFVVIKGPGQLRIDLDAVLAGKDGTLRHPGERPAMVFLWNNATLINTSRKPLGAGNIIYAIGDSCYLNFPNIDPAKNKFDGRYVVTSNLGYSFACYGGPKNMLELIYKMNDRVTSGLPDFVMMSAREFFRDEDEGMTIQSYIKENKILQQTLGLLSKPEPVEELDQAEIEKMNAEAMDRLFSF